MARRAILTMACSGAAFRPSAIGWCFGFGYFLGGLWWLGNALLVEADEFAWAVPLAVIGLPAFLAFFYAFAAAFARILWSDGMGRIAALAFAFGLFEWLRSFVLTGFPWNAIGYAAMPVPLMMQSAAVIGLAGVNMLAVFVFAAPALIGTRKGVRVGLGLAVAAGRRAFRLRLLPAGTAVAAACRSGRDRPSRPAADRPVQEAR